MRPSITEILKRLRKLEDTKNSEIYFCVCKPIHAGEMDKAPYKTIEDTVKAFKKKNGVRMGDHLIVFLPSASDNPVIGYTFS